MEHLFQSALLTSDIGTMHHLKGKILQLGIATML